MGFDGIPRPSQITPYTDALNPYIAGNAARAEQAGKPLVKGPQREEQIKSVHKEERQYHEADDEEENEEGFTEEEAEQVRLFARMRGLMNFSLESGTRYEFRMNPETGLMDLVEADSGQVVLTLTPEELLQLSRKIQRYAGMLTDRSA